MRIQKISPKYFSTKLSDPKLEDYIDVYEDQVQGWFLDFAKQMHSNEHAGFAALQIVFSYFEAHSVNITGEDSRGKSESFFKRGVLSVFPELTSYSGMNEVLLDSTLSALYQDGRCGFFHSGITRRRFVISDGDPIIRIGADPETGTLAIQIFIDRRKFIDRIFEHFRQYISRLRDPSEVELRSRFAAAQSLLHGELRIHR